MSKKLITACLGLVAFAAFALPTGASAAKVTHPTGTLMPIRNATACGQAGATGCLTGTNVGITKFMNAAGTSTLLECTKAVITATLTKNNGTEVEASVKTATFEGSGTSFNGMNECTGSFGNATVTTNGEDEGVKVDEGTVKNGTPWCIKSVSGKDEFTIRGGTCNQEAREITFILDSTTAGECKYSRASTGGTITTDTTGDAQMTVVGGTNPFKGEAGNNILCPAEGSLQMTFTVETDATNTEPVYFSE